MWSFWFQLDSHMGLQFGYPLCWSWPTCWGLDQNTETLFHGASLLVDINSGLFTWQVVEVGKVSGISAWNWHSVTSVAFLVKASHKINPDSGGEKDSIFWVRRAAKSYCKGCEYREEWSWSIVSMFYNLLHHLSPQGLACCPVESSVCPPGLSRSLPK